MLRPAELPLTRLLGLAAAALIVMGATVLTIPASARSQQSPGTNTLRSQNVQLAANQQSATLAVYSLDARLAAADDRLAALRRSLQTLEGRKKALRVERRIAVRNERLAQSRLSERLVRMYETPNPTTIEILFGSVSLDDALTQIDSQRRVAELANQVFKETEFAQGALRHASRALATQSARLSATVASATATRNALAQARAQRVAFISELRHKQQYNSSRIADIEAQAAAAVVKTRQLTKGPLRSTTVTPVDSSSAPPASATQPLPTQPSAPAPESGDRVITMQVTAYSLPGHTASGLPVGPGVVAVNPNVIPLGTHMYIPGYGEGVAADVGTAIIGDRLDVWFPTLAQAQAWGLHTVDVTVHYG